MRRIAMVLMVIAVSMSTFAAHRCWLEISIQHSAINNPSIFKRPSLAAKDGDVIEVPGGTYPGPIVIDKSIKLIGAISRS